MSVEPTIPHQVDEASLHKVLEIARRMGSEQALDPLLTLILDEATKLLDAERASLFLYDARTDELYSKIAQKSEIGEIRFPADKGIAGFIAHNKACVNIPDAYQDPRFNPEPDKNTGFRTRSILGCPMLDLEGNLVGVLEVLNKHGGPFTLADEYLVAVLGSQAGVALDRARLQDEYHAKIEIERDLDVARRIQKALMPREVPDAPGFDIAGWSEPADQTGGDMYDLFATPTGEVGFLLGDATGHGIGPALMISETRAAIRAVASDCSDLAKILAVANELLVNDASDGRFVTLLAGLLDGQTKRIRYSSAGQGPTFLLRRDGGRVESLEPTGLPLGIMVGPEWPEVELTMTPGDLLLVVSDGILECANAANDMIGADRFVAEVQRHRDRSAAEIVEAIARMTEDFAAGEPFRDDRTAIVIKRTE
ncbi:MAG: SpoIIE family protein phosphatase [Planctomycetes bacterium]|nr:SpoIIE family protein phosphatase [Planctomycetota bacterium]